MLCAYELACFCESKGAYSRHPYSLLSETEGPLSDGFLVSFGDVTLVWERDSIVKKLEWSTAVIATPFKTHLQRATLTKESSQCANQKCRNDVARYV